MSLNQTTKGFFNKNIFNMLKDNCFFINAARAKIVDDLALIEAVKTRKIKIACLDIINPEPKYDKKIHFNKFSKIKNIYLTPHLAAMTDDCQKQIGKYISRKIVKYIKNNY